MNLSRLDRTELGTGWDDVTYGLGVCPISSNRFAVMISGLSGS